MQSYRQLIVLARACAPRGGEETQVSNTWMSCDMREVRTDLDCARVQRESRGSS